MHSRDPRAVEPRVEWPLDARDKIRTSDADDAGRRAAIFGRVGKERFDEFRRARDSAARQMKHAVEHAIVPSAREILRDGKDRVGEVKRRGRIDALVLNNLQRVTVNRASQQVGQRVAAERAEHQRSAQDDVVRIRGGDSGFAEGFGAPIGAQWMQWVVFSIRGRACSVEDIRAGEMDQWHAEAARGACDRGRTIDIDGMRKLGLDFRPFGIGVACRIHHDVGLARRNGGPDRRRIGQFELRPSDGEHIDAARCAHFEEGPG